MLMLKNFYPLEHFALGLSNCDAYALLFVIWRNFLEINEDDCGDDLVLWNYVIIETTDTGARIGSDEHAVELSTA